MVLETGGGDTTDFSDSPDFYELSLEIPRM